VNNSTYSCLACGTAISQTEHTISNRHHHLSLCTKHQKLLEPGKATRYAKKLFIKLWVRKLPVELEYKDRNDRTIDIAIPGKLHIEVEGWHHDEAKYALDDLTRIISSLENGIVTIRLPNQLIYNDYYFEQTLDKLEKLANSFDKKIA
jgi:hypothetical protein